MRKMVVDTVTVFLLVLLSIFCILGGKTSTITGKIAGIFKIYWWKMPCKEENLGNKNSFLVASKDVNNFRLIELASNYLRLKWLEFSFFSCNHFVENCFQDIVENKKEKSFLRSQISFVQLSWKHGSRLSFSKSSAFLVLRLIIIVTGDYSTSTIYPKPCIEFESQNLKSQHSLKSNLLNRHTRYCR